MNREIYELGKKNYAEGIEIKAMDHVAKEARISWLCGYLDAALENRVLARSSANRNGRGFLPVNRPTAMQPLQRLAADTQADQLGATPSSSA